MKTFLTHNRILLIATAMIVLGLIYSGQFFSQAIRQIPLESALKSQFLLLAQKDATLGEQRVKMEQLAKATEGINNNKKPIQSHLDFMHYLEGIIQKANARMILLPQEGKITEGEYQILEIQFQVQGSLASILSIIYQLEQKDRMGNISYAHLATQTIRRNRQRKQVLVAIITFKRLITNQNEKINFP